MAVLKSSELSGNCCDSIFIGWLPSLPPNNLAQAVNDELTEKVAKTDDIGRSPFLFNYVFSMETSSDSWNEAIGHTLLRKLNNTNIM